jgi:hypothetical protein
VTLCSAGTSGGSERPEVVLSAELCHLAGDGPGCQLGTGPLLRPGAVLHPELARRIACDCRLQVIVRDQGGRALPHCAGMAHQRAHPPGRWLQLTRLRAEALSLRPSHSALGPGGGTDLDNLVLVCSFHHKLVPEGGWRVTLRDGLGALWLHPDGRSYEPGPPKVPELVDRS